MTDNILTYLDSYCERAGVAGLYAEPLNLVTNAFFILAAFLVARALKQTPAPGKRTDLWFLVLFLFSIGIGSGLWHAMPTGSTVLMDVIPITLFINLYIVSCLRRLFALTWCKLFFYWAVYFAAGLVAQKTLPADLLNGTIMYIPTYAMLVIITLALKLRDPVAGRAFMVATGVWTLSLIFRTIDRDICPGLGIGTHFLWHTLNAWVLWRLSMVLVDKTRA